MTTMSTNERALPVARHAGEKIHGLIWSRRMVQGTVAKAVGVSPSTFSKKLRGEVPITVDELMRIAGVLGVDPGDLLPRLDSNQQPSGYASLQVRAPGGEVVHLDHRRRPPPRVVPVLSVVK